MSTNNHFYLRDNTKVLGNSQLSDKAKERILLAKAPHTIDAYESDWNDFVDWCTYKKASYYPASPETISNYINDLADYAKANTISRRISAISENFNAAGLAENPCTSPLVKQALRGIRRLKGTYQQGKTPVLLEDLIDIIEGMPKWDIPPIVQIRDKAILLIGFMGAFRRSEISALRLENISFSPKGMEIFIANSKADQEGQGAVVAIPYIDDERLCAVLAVRKWLQVSQITSGPLFRGFTKSMSLRKTALSDKSIADIVKKYMALIGLDPSMYGAHSLRHGFATTAAAYGVEERNIMRQTRHHSVNMVRRYINEANKFVDNPITSIFNQRIHR